MTASAFSLSDPRYHDLAPVLLDELRDGSILADSTAKAIVLRAAQAGVVVDVDTVLSEARQSIDTVNRARQRINGAAHRPRAAVVAGPDDGAAFFLHEDGIAQAFAKVYAGRLLYSHGAGAWFEWDGTRWKRDDTRRAFAYCRELARHLNTTGAAKWASATTAKGVESFARADPAFAVSGREFDADPWLLGTPAGTFDIRTMTLREADPKDYITRQTSVAPAAGTPTRWLQFLDEATGGDSDLIAYLHRLAGYAAVGEAREECLIFTWGDGGNGKGTFLGALSDILGDYAKTASMDVLLASRGERHPTDLASLAGARLVTAQESEEGRRWDAQRVKALTGRDVIAARFMRQDFFEFRAQFTLIVASNNRPSIARVDDAWRRRLQLVPFTRKPAAVDGQLKEKLRGEYPQILAWMLEGVRLWLAQGLAPPAAVRAATADYLADQDVIGQWLAECCEPDAAAITERKDLYGSLRAWCDARGMNCGSLHSLTQELGRRGYPQHATRKTRPIRGLRLVWGGAQ